MTNKIFIFLVLLIVVGGPFAWKNYYQPYAENQKLRERQQEVMRTAKEFRATRAVTINIPLEVPDGFFLFESSDPDKGPEGSFVLKYLNSLGAEILIAESEGTSFTARRNFSDLSAADGFREVSIDSGLGYYARSDPSADPRRQRLVFTKKNVIVTIIFSPGSDGAKLPDADMLKLAETL